MSKIANDNPLEGQDGLADDVILPFQLESSGVRGRVVRLGPAMDAIIKAHNYPAPVAHLLAETIVLTALLSSMLKYEGVFTLQASGEGVLKTLVCDTTTQGDIRGYAGFDEAGLTALAGNGGRYEGLSLETLLGKGYVAFTVDQGAHTERYQGIVELRGDTLGQAVRHYFEQSEQIETSIHIHVTRDEAGQWRGGGLILQRLPEDERFDMVNKVTSIAANGREERDEDWNRASILASSVKGEELSDAKLQGEELLVRLFHEEGVRVFESKNVQKACRCSEARVENVLRSLSEEERREAADEHGIVTMTCEFCAHCYSFDISRL